MAKKIDWLYHRKACTTCKKAHEFLEPAKITVVETVDATKVRYGADTVLSLFKSAKRLIAIKGKKVSKFDLVKDRPDDETLLSVLIGPTGNLRAPTAIVGSTVVVGFNPEAYAEIFGT